MDPVEPERFDWVFLFLILIILRIKKVLVIECNVVAFARSIVKLISICYNNKRKNPNSMFWQLKRTADASYNQLRLFHGFSSNVDMVERTVL
ncbi:MAG TPA: hypothetical protein DEF02_03005 [Clostridiales bacterium]|nr:hypothetical protein [Clostridiales bacterium]